MHVVDPLPRDVHDIENVFIPMPDGARLAARVWLPDGAEQHPVPAVLEYLPYRKRDITRERDEVNHPYLAAHGYACVRVDMRGSGDSDGVIVDEYRPAELDDACEVIAWLREQPWCDGTVGMFGISWGGFNALQVAARRPEGLEAIISCSASDDIYHDNMHYMGGCLLTDNLSEATTMFAFNSLPPDPEVVGSRWRDMWHERLEGSGLWLETWLQHQRRDGYWKPASVCEDYEAIACPVMAVGGWADGYTNAVLRLLEHLDVPRQGLIGPWGHKYPHMGVPGPAIGFLQHMVRWWDHWLKGIDTGIMDSPALRVWMQDTIEPDTAYRERPGRWVGLDQWPAPEVDVRQFDLAPHSLVAPGELDDADRTDLVVQSPMTVGTFGGKWASYAAPPDLPYDQRLEDGGALVFETAPLAEVLDLVGRPILCLRVAASAPQAMVAVRLSDVAPDGKATRITYGLLNLTHRGGHEDPEPVEPGQPYDVEVALNGLAQRLPRGHRLRLSVSSSYWPLAWPPPHDVALTISTGRSHLEVPVLSAGAGDREVPGFDDPEGAAPLATTQLAEGDAQWRVVRDFSTHEAALEIVKDGGAWRIDDTGTQLARRTDEWYRIVDDDPLSARGETETVRRLVRDDWAVEVRTRTVLTCTAEDFHVHAQLDAYELDASRGDPRVHAQTWVRTIPRDHV